MEKYISGRQSFPGTEVTCVPGKAADCGRAPQGWEKMSLSLTVTWNIHCFIFQSVGNVQTSDFAVEN